jgi:glycosyltransferase involved in cell wall biosynthesis
MQNQSKIIDNKPLVSVVICTFNGELYIEEQLTTVCEQSYTNLEIIIVDDCSTDNTLTILKKASEKDSRIQLFVNENNIGYNKNFNKAVGLSSGEIIAFCDQDDIWETKKIEILLNAWPEEAVLIYSNSIRFHGKLDKSKCKKNNLYRRFEGKDPRKIALFNTINGHAMLVKRELVNLSMPFPENVFYDWRIAVIAAVNGGVAYVDEILVYQRVHEQNASFGQHTQEGYKNEREAFQNKIARHNKVFIETPNLNKKDRQFFEKLTDYWGSRDKKKSSIRLFFFMIKYRKPLFWYKKRTIGLFSHIKHSFLISFN